jgi:uncharacterized membrane protein YhhN
MKKAIIFIFYFLNGTICLIFLNQSAFWPGFISKALIIPILMILFFISFKSLKKRIHILLFAGLLFSWAGDIVLELATKNPNLFVIGLASFLFAHVMYILVFFHTPGKNYIQKHRLHILVPVAIYGIALVSFLYNDLSEMRFPVILYTIVILTMVTAAINRKDKVNMMSFTMVLAGAIFFVISDSVIALNKFSFKFESSETIIMSTYIVAQYLIVAGYIFQFRENQIISKPESLSYEN